MQMEPTLFLQGNCWSQSLSHTGFPEGKKPKRAFMTYPADWPKWDCLYETIQTKIINPSPESLLLSSLVHANSPRILVCPFHIVPSGEHRAPRCYLGAFGTEQWVRRRWWWQAERKGLKVLSPLGPGSKAQVLQPGEAQNLFFPRARGDGETFPQTAQGRGGTPIPEVFKNHGSVALGGMV